MVRVILQEMNVLLCNGNMAVCVSTGGVDSPKIRGDGDIRIFVALFPYDPATMSPNPDAAEEELPFTEGQIIKVCPRIAQTLLEDWNLDNHACFSFKASLISSHEMKGHSMPKVKPFLHSSPHPGSRR